MDEFYLDEVSVNSWLDKKSLFGREDTRATVTAWLSSKGEARVNFGKPITALYEEELEAMLNACKKARKMYAAAHKLDSNE